MIIARRSLVAMLIVATGAIAASASPRALPAQASGLSPELAAAKAALEKYKDPILAVHDGYFSSVACLEYSKGMSGHGGMDYKAGGMGVHFLNASLIGPTLDPTKPQVLIYEPVGDKLVLAAAEWFSPTEVSKTPPTIFGQTLQGPMAGHEPVIPEAMHHWDLHVWFWKANPSGMFRSTNPNIKCPKRAYSFDEEPPKLVKP